MSKSVLLAMSGGIDSSAAAVILMNAGYEVHGLTFRIDGVSSLAVENAWGICKKLNIPHEYIDITERFKREVIEYFRDEYSRGRTPNPCIKCNRTIKFGYIYDYAMENGYDHVSTGHYATIKETDGRYYLEKASDETRDQTYFLYVLKEEQLKNIIFPLNGVPKSKARKICADAGLMPADSKESREICFVREDYRDYLEKKLDIKIRKGNFVDKDGNVLAKHDGLHRYTIGQRKGLGFTMGKPIFITGFDEAASNIIIGEDKDLFTDELKMENISLINGSLPNQGEYYVKIRYGAEPAKVREMKISNDNAVKICLEESVRAATPGQSAVIYLGNRVVGGGIIQ